MLKAAIHLGAKFEIPNPKSEIIPNIQTPNKTKNENIIVQITQPMREWVMVRWP